MRKDMGEHLIQRKNEKGFTLIEIVLVLAIAGLIFVIVFLAVQGAQRGRRDTERKSAVARLIAAAEQVASNTPAGTYPANCAGIGTAYNDQGATYPCSDTVADITHLHYRRGQQCNPAGTDFAATVPANNLRITAVRVGLETGGAMYCQDND